MKVALIQMDSGPDKKNNIEKASAFVEEAARNKAEFILLPEIFNYRGPVPELKFLEAISENIDGESISVFAARAKKYNVFILAGSIYEKIPNKQKVYNSSVCINNNGEADCVYRKINLFKAIVGDKQISESNLYEPGKQAVTTQIQNFRVGLSICFDLRFPELFQTYRRQQADLVCLPSSFTMETGKAHWEVLCRARAIENQCYILAVNQVGIDGNGVQTYGNSMVVNPWGEILSRASSDSEEIIYSELDRESIIAVRKRIFLE